MIQDLAAGDPQRVQPNSATHPGYQHSPAGSRPGFPAVAAVAILPVRDFPVGPPAPVPSSASEDQPQALPVRNRLYSSADSEAAMGFLADLPDVDHDTG